MALTVPWAKKARDLVANMLDPDRLFAWPFARVLLVYFPDVTEERLTEADALVKINARRESKGLPPLARLPFSKG